ncbi:ParB-like chromosome segregation protein Spo0J [Amycolatopsis bartoniae]|nr:ParB N-terminal domain-containing protein [Amycolatopsis bartoniae]MBB2940126.1 ParB-like chromosome segregation protein Spo0J [Amycolatopsis bartoniae]TVT07697.1 streptomycin biosynthesis protein [Amycolatopsis bartoniae]
MTVDAHGEPWPDPKLEALPVELVPIARLTVAGSPRVGGADPEHIRVLAGTSTVFPPILVHRPTMRVIDGAHRVHAALLRDERQIEVRYFDGSEDDAFVLSVRLNVTHGLPLSRADRNSAAEKILHAHPDWSDRAVAAISGLSDKTVASIRRRTSAEFPQLSHRVGRDGRVRPNNAAAGRRRAAAYVQHRPHARPREIAEAAGISVTTARDVRGRVREGLHPVPAGRAGAGTAERAADAGPEGGADGALFSSLRRLRSDPSFRHHETGRMLLRLLDTSMLIAVEQDRLVDGVPVHGTDAVKQVATQYAQAWQRFADQLENRGRMFG